MNERDCREAEQLPWERLLDLFVQMLGRVRVDDDGTAWLPMSDWAPTEVLAYEVTRRTEEPNTVEDMMLRRLGLATMTLLAGIRYGTDHLVAWTAEWVVARAELLVYDIGADVPTETPLLEVPETPPTWTPPALVTNDPLSDYVDVEGGYRWFYDGRPPEPVEPVQT